MRAFATIAAAVVVVGLGASAAAADAPVMVVAEDEVAAATLRLIEQRVADRRPLRSPLPWPNGGVELEEQARRERSEHVAEALRAESGEDVIESEG